MIRKTWNTRLKEARETAGVTQDELADILGIQQPAYSKKENGETPLTIEEARKIVNYLNVSGGDIFFNF